MQLSAAALLPPPSPHPTGLRYRPPLQSSLQISSTGHASAEACVFTNPSKSQNFGQYRPKWSVLQAMGPRSVKHIASQGRTRSVESSQKVRGGRRACAGEDKHPCLRLSDPPAALAGILLRAMVVRLHRCSCLPVAGPARGARGSSSRPSSGSSRTSCCASPEHAGGRV